MFTDNDDSDDKLSSELLKKNNRSPEENAELDEHKALSVLQRWGEMREFSLGACPLVPEHVEMRSLWNADKPGLPRVRRNKHTCVHTHTHICGKYTPAHTNPCLNQVFSQSVFRATDTFKHRNTHTHPQIL